jgi:hypothetical protein
MHACAHDPTPRSILKSSSSTAIGIAQAAAGKRPRGQGTGSSRKPLSMISRKWSKATMTMDCVTQKVQTVHKSIERPTIEETKKETLFIDVDNHDCMS